MLQLLLRFPTGIISRYVLHWFPVFPSWFELWLPTVVICLTAPPLSASFSCLSHLLVSSPVFPGITSQGNNLYSNPCLSITSVQSLSRVWLFATPWTAAHQASLSNTNSRSLLKLMSIELVMPSNHFILHRPLLLLPSIFPSIRIFSKESVLIRWPKYGCFSFTISWRMVNEWIVWTNFLEVGLVGYPCSLRDSQESSPTLQLKSINSSALSFLYSPTLTSKHDYWKNYRLD